MSVCGEPMAVPAMSRCAQGVSLTKRCRNCAAVIEPPWRAAGVLHVGESWNRSSCRSSVRAACARRFSPVALPGRDSSSSASSSSLENRPAYSLPSATMIAPVRVARSTMNFGLKRSWQYQSTSASTRRPSASVLMTSMVWPDMRGHDVAGALGVAVGHVLDEAEDADGVDLGLAGGERMHQAGDAAAPPMSPFMSSMPAAGLIEMPPVSKQTPLPTKATGLLALLRALRAVPAHDDQPAVAARALADAEQRAHAELLHLVLVEDLDLDAELLQRFGASANSTGPRTLAGSLTRSNKMPGTSAASGIATLRCDLTSVLRTDAQESRTHRRAGTVACGNRFWVVARSPSTCACRRCRRHPDPDRGREQDELAAAGQAPPGSTSRLVTFPPVAGATVCPRRVP